MTVRTDVAAGQDGRVRDDEIEHVEGEVAEELVEVSFMAHEPNGLGQAERRLQEPAHDELRHHVGDADVEAQRLPGGAALDRLHHLAAEREDLFGVTEDHLADLGQSELAPLLREQLLAELLLERMDLRAQGRMGRMQHPACRHQAALPRHDPEVEKVVVIGPLHVEENMSAKTTCHVETS